MTRIITDLVHGYLKLARGLARGAMWLVVLAAVSVVIALPFWYAARYAPRIFTAVGLTLLVVAVALYVIRRRRGGSVPRNGRVGRWIGTLGVTALVVVGITTATPGVTAVGLLAATSLVAVRLARAPVR